MQTSLHIMHTNCLLFSVPTTTTTTQAPTTTVPGVIDVRLPKDLVPWKYHLKLRPHLYSDKPSEFYFNGSVEILLNVTKATDVITLHYRNLNISSEKITVTKEEGGDVKVQ